MDEVTDPNLSIVVEGNPIRDGGPKSHMLNKIEDTCILSLAITGQRNNIIKKIPSNRMFHHKDYLFWFSQSKSYSTLVKPVYGYIDPNYITGFVDGEGSFKISIYKKKECKTGWWISPSFVIEVHEKDANILYQIKSYFDVGNISIRKSNGQVIYTVASVKDLEQKIIPHFVKYPLLTKKWEDFMLFCSAVELIIQKKHLSLEGIKEIISVRASMNLGLTETLKKNFPNTKPINKQIRTEDIAIYSPYWFAGFTEAEGCFWVSVNKSKSYKIGYQTQLKFVVTQHSRDEKLFESFVKYGLFPHLFSIDRDEGSGAECGKVQKGSGNASVYFVVTKFIDLEKKIFPFFLPSAAPAFIFCGLFPHLFNIDRDEGSGAKKMKQRRPGLKYNLLCSKNKEFIDFCNIHFLVKSKAHLTESGLNQILEIKSGMNRGRNLYKVNDGEIPMSVPNKINVGSFINVKNGIQKREFHSNVRASLRIGPHNEDVTSVIIGSLLGKSIINTKPRDGTRIVLRLKSNMEYVQWIYNFFFARGYCSNLEPRMYKRVLKNKGSDDKTHYGYEFNTYTFRSFNWIHKMFYKKGVKYINVDLVPKYITPLALAIWISDDGGWAKPGVRIATNSFNLKEVEFLVKVLQSKFGLDCTIQTLKPSGNCNIYIKGSSVPKLRELILPYLHTSMHYKLGL